MGKRLGHRPRRVWKTSILAPRGPVALFGLLCLACGLAAAPAQAIELGPAGRAMAAVLEARLASLFADRAQYPMAGHEAADGPQLISDLTAQHDAPMFTPLRCPPAAPVKRYDIAALNVVIWLNRWGHNDPNGMIFATLDRVVAAQAQSAIREAGHFGLSLGLGDDAIQPLTLRVNVGDCLRISLTNMLEQPTSFHVHGADLVMAQSGAPALASNPDTMAFPGETVSYEWYVTQDYYSENTHYAHPHGPNGRFQVSHGLFGAVIVEPAGSRYFDQRIGAALCTGDDDAQTCAATWDAMISPGEGPDFREYAMFYHEVGTENVGVRDRNGREMPLLDEFTGSYKPSGRAINYRSEPFLVRLQQAQRDVDFYRDWQADESLAYSSYAFGDPGTPIPQSYLGDPVKFRLIHGGGETFHVPHLHGGGIQWQRQPDMGNDQDDYVPLNAGLQKQFESSMPSSGNDAQTIGPSETYELEVGCGAGGCQQAVGDFLFHCHIASHYVSGMWHFWRVYNSLQDAAGKTDDLSVLAELPDRRGGMEPAVASDELVGRTVEFSGRVIAVDTGNLAFLVEAQLPPQGQPRDAQDAQVFDWLRDGDRYFNEPETEAVWPSFAAASPGVRLALMFAADTGKLAWPFLRPHLGERPPFAPHHGPAPYLAPLGHDEGDGVPLPGTNGEASLCPADAPRRFYNIHAIQTPIEVAEGEIEPDGMLFVLQENEQRARTDPDFKVPLAIRANQGDCVDVVLINELDGLFNELRPEPNLDKTNIHIHFVQFDVQASDGVATGAAFEQAPRPIHRAGQTTGLTEAATAGAERISVADATLFHIGAEIAVGIDQASEVFETAAIAAIDGNRIVLSAPLRNAHRAGEGVSVEFVRYRWYVARQNGAIYFHDHVDALGRWGRGLFGGLIAEPRGATYHDPQTGAEIASGPIADIHTDREVVPGLDGSFREFVLFFTDRNPTVFRSINMRVESMFTLSPRGKGPQDQVMSSARHGDPRTPILEAYAGDPIMLRLLTTATEEIHPFAITGHRFRQERFQENSPLINNIAVGVSERFNAYIESAGGPTAQPGDYVYYDGIERHFQRGNWGLLRVHGGLTGGLQPLPGRAPPELAATEPGNPCPPDAPLRQVAVGVATTPTTVNFGDGAHLETVRRYVRRPGGQPASFISAEDPPMVLRAHVGDCLEIAFTNSSFGFAGIHVEGAYFDPHTGYGGEVGRNGSLVTAPGETNSYRYYLPDQPGVLRIRDFTSVFRNGELGLHAALVVEPAGATWHDPVTDAPLAEGIEAVIRLPDGSYFREFVILFIEQDTAIGRFSMPYDEHVDSDVAVNFRRTPLAPRIRDLGRRNPRRFANLYNDSIAGPPNTNIFVATAGEDVRFRVVSSYSEQPQVFSIEGHDWEITPSLDGSDVMSSHILSSSGVLNVNLRAAGGPAGRPGDYLWLNHRMAFLEAGQWGILRILPAGPDTALGPRRALARVEQARLR